MVTEEIREKEHFKDEEHNEKLDEDNQPQCASERHASEAVAIELPDVQYKMFHIMQGHRSTKIGQSLILATISCIKNQYSPQNSISDWSAKILGRALSLGPTSIFFSHLSEGCYFCDRKKER